MKKLRNKIFITVLGILSIALFTFLLIFNLQDYNEQRNVIKRNLSFNGLIQRNLPFEPADQTSTPQPNRDRNIRFMDANAMTVILDENDSIIEIINHSNEEIETSKLKEVATAILNEENKETEHIGNLYFDKYSYAYHKGHELIIIDNSFVQENLYGGLKTSLLYLVALEIVFIIISKLISNWISRPVEDAFNKQKDFIADASHELKTPISVITASAEALEANPKEKKWLNNIKSESERMNNLVIDLLDLAKTENGTMELSLGNLSKVVEHTVLTFEVKAFEKNIKLDYHIDKDINIKMNENSIRQVIEILLDNAIKHSHEKGKVEVNLKDGNNIELTVSNTGDEIPKGEEEKIFERFYRVDKARNRDDNRYGLGLAIAKNIVTMHNGTIKAFSKSGKTTLQINLKK